MADLRGAVGSHSSCQAATRLGYVDKRLSSYADTRGETLPWWTRSAGFAVFKRSWPFKHQRIGAACSEKDSARFLKPSGGRAQRRAACKPKPYLGLAESYLGLAKTSLAWLNPI